MLQFDIIRIVGRSIKRYILKTEETLDGVVKLMRTVSVHSTVEAFVRALRFARVLFSLWTDVCLK